MFNRREFLAATAASTAMAGWPLMSRAQSLETARILVGFPPGGTVDAVARRVADKLRGTYAKTVLVENKPGAGGRLAVEELKRSAPDGSTLLVTPAAMITLYPHLYTKLAYGIDDVTPVSTVAQVAFALGVGPAVPDSVKTVKDFLAWAKANPDQAAYGSPGAGSPPHMEGALLSKESGVELRHVPYRGSAPGIQDLLGGQIASFSSPIGDYLPHLKSGKLRVLATSGPTRSRFAPDVPTYTEQGFKVLEQVEWYGLFLPAKASPELAQRLAAAVRQGMGAPDMAEGLAAFGLEPKVSSPAELAKAVKEENAAWGPIVKKVGFTPEA
jgi:tripartite-type tricarboxylate transporter receptor subunit TctC